MEDIGPIDNETIGPNQKVPYIKPELKEGTQIYINNPQHKLHLEQGTITNRDHHQYRIQLTSTNPKINKKQLWVPEHWIEPLPKELQ